MRKRAKPLPEEKPNLRQWPFCLTDRCAIGLAGAVLVLAVLGAYHNCFSVPFLFDDRDSITENRTIRQLWPVWPVLLPPARGITVGGRPVVNLSLAVNYAFGGTAVWGYHAVNVTAHLMASLILLGILRRTLLLNPGLRGRYAVAALPLALAVALLWALHPLQTESVTYVVQRAESLMGLFYLLTLYAFIRGTQSGTAGWYVLAVAACLMGMATKEVMVSAPLMVWLYDRTFVAGTFREALRQRWRVHAGLSAGWLLLAYLVERTGEFGSERAGFQTPVAWWSYALTQLWAIAHYVRLSIWPHPLVFDYGTFLATSAIQVVPSVLLVVLLVAGTAVSVWRWPSIGILGCWFFAILAPTSSVMPLAGQTVAEHRMYLPLVAVVALGVFGGYAWVGRRCLGVFLTLGVVFGLLTLQRNEDYRSEVAIWSDTVAKRPDNGRAHDLLGVALFRAGRLPEAIGHHEQALRICPNYADAQNNLGYTLDQQGKRKEAIEHYRQALRINPDHERAHNNLGLALAEQGRFEEAAEHFAAVVRLEPHDADTLYNLANALAGQGRFAEATPYLQEVVQLKPGDAEAREKLGGALARQGKAAEAAAQFTEVIRLRPDGTAHYNLALALVIQGNSESAASHYREAIRLQPDWPVALNDLAWILATHRMAEVRNGAEAIRLAERACELVQRKEAAFLGTLDAAYAEAGRFADAITTAKQARDLAAANGQKALAALAESRLKLYEAGQPYRQN